jgi:hypothetical protein
MYNSGKIEIVLFRMRESNRMLKFERESDDGQATCRFILESGFIKCVFDIPTPMALSEEDFRDLADCTFEGEINGRLQRRYFSFDDCNGGQYIVLQKEAPVGDAPAIVSGRLHGCQA